MILGIITILIASLALLVAGLQYLTRHRPFLGVTNIKMIENPSDRTVLLLRIDVTNMGLVPAKEAQMTIHQGFESNDGSLVISKHELGAIFPTQTVFANVFQGERLLVDERMESMTLSVNATINYRGPIRIGWKQFGYGVYYTHQPLYLHSSGDWGASPQGKAEIR